MGHMRTFRLRPRSGWGRPARVAARRLAASRAVPQACRRPAAAQAGAEVWRRRLALERTVGADQERSPIVAHLEVGDLLLWGSRTVHRSAASEKVPTTAAPQRCVSLVCMQPRAACPVGVLAERQAAALRCITNNIGWTGGWTGGGPGVDRWVDAEKTGRLRSKIPARVSDNRGSRRRS